jgi:hypothetical protein
MNIEAPALVVFKERFLDCVNHVTCSYMQDCVEESFIKVYYSIYLSN